MDRRNKALDCQYSNDYESERFNPSKGVRAGGPALDGIQRPWQPVADPAWH